MNTADPLTHVTVFFSAMNCENDENPATEVHLVHTGWRSTTEWEEARLWFQNAWNMAFQALVTSLNG
jgi:hypothetical protein